MLSEVVENDLVLRYAESFARYLAYRYKNLLNEAEAYLTVAESVVMIGDEYGFTSKLTEQRKMLEYEHEKEIKSRAQAMTGAAN